MRLVKGSAVAIDDQTCHVLVCRKIPLNVSSTSSLLGCSTISLLNMSWIAGQIQPTFVNLNSGDVGDFLVWFFATKTLFKSVFCDKSNSIRGIRISTLFTSARTNREKLHETQHFLMIHSDPPSSCQGRSCTCLSAFYLL